MYLFSFFFFFSLYQFFGSWFSNKLLVILSLECFTLLLVMVFVKISLTYCESFFIPLALSVFMVLDSVFCASMLVSCSRRSGGMEYFSSSF